MNRHTKIFITRAFTKRKTEIHKLCDYRQAYHTKKIGKYVNKQHQLLETARYSA